MEVRIETPLPRPFAFHNLCLGDRLVYYSRITTENPRVYIKTGRASMTALTDGTDYPVKDINEPKFVRVLIRRMSVEVDQ